jgi:hypothetical protein
MIEFDPDKSWWSLLFAVIMLVAGGLPLLVKFNVLSWNISWLTGTIGTIAVYVLSLGALFLIIDSFMEGLDEPNGLITFIIGVLLLAAGILTFLGILPFLSEILTPIVYYWIFAIEGILLFIGSFFMG